MELEKLIKETPQEIFSLVEGFAQDFKETWTTERTQEFERMLADESRWSSGIIVFLHSETRGFFPPYLKEKAAFISVEELNYDFWTYKDEEKRIQNKCIKKVYWIVIRKQSEIVISRSMQERFKKFPSLLAKINSEITKWGMKIEL